MAPYSFARRPGPNWTPQLSTFQRKTYAPSCLIIVTHCDEMTINKVNNGYNLTGQFNFGKLYWLGLLYLSSGQRDRCLHAPRQPVAYTYV